tara:strand:- start:24127 stop:26334 length:2208 start_codon:yes stop_codon:yes gene_type:complete
MKSVHIIFNFLFLNIVFSQNTYSNDKSIIAVETKTPPKIDGNVLDDPVWKNISQTTGFIQQSPDEGKPASEKTIVKIAFTNDHFYLSVVCYSDQPENIIINDTRRDSPLDDMDSFIFILDTFNDNQNGYAFGTNAAGIEYDAQITKGGENIARIGRFSSGAGGAFNINWDGSWTVKTKIHNDRWSAEFKIPFKTLRYKSEKTQEWGVNFQRVNASIQEVSHWSPINRQFTVNRLISAGALTGVSPPLSQNIKFIPYFLTQRNSNSVDEEKTKAYESVAGFDGKVSIGSGLNLDLTYNTDFAQAEADEQQINLDRFSLFFPEKRAFFLENAGLFSVGDNSFGGSEVSMFFSRRIGLAGAGNQVPINGGARLTGTIANMRVGLLNMSTKPSQGRPSNEYQILRLKKELPNRSHIGAIATNLIKLDSEKYSNEVVALDAKWGIGEVSQIDGYTAISNTPNLDKEKAYAFRLQASSTGKMFSNALSYTEIGEDFNPEMGFLKRSGGYRKWSGRIFTRLRPDNNLGVLEIRPHVNYDGYWKLDGFHQTGKLHVDNHLEFRSGYEIHTGINFTKEGLIEDFDIFPSKSIVVPKSTYDHMEAQLYYTSPPTSKISFSVMNYIGGFFGGDRISSSPRLKIRFGDKFNSEISYNYNNVNLPGGNFITYLSRSRLTYSFNPKMYIQALLQYNNQSNESFINWRFIIQRSAASGLYVVYNQMEDYDGIPTKRNNTLILKYSHLFDF